MLKGFVFLLLFASTKEAMAQVYETQKAAKAAIPGGVYTTGKGWTVKAGDTLALGVGTMPDRGYAFIHEFPTALNFSTAIDYTQRKLPSTYAGRYMVVDEVLPSGSKATGFVIEVKLKGMGGSRWLCNLEQAIAAGEVVKK